MAKKAVKKVVKKKAAPQPEELLDAEPEDLAEDNTPKVSDLSGVPLEEILLEVKRRNLSFVVLPSDANLVMSVKAIGDEDAVEPSDDPEDPEEPEGADELEPVEDEEPAAEVEVGSQVTFEDKDEGPLQGTVVGIEGGVATVHVEGEGDEVYEYEVPVEQLSAVQGDDDEDGDPESWDNFSVDNLGLQKRVAAKLAKLKIEEIGKLREAIESGKLKGKLSDAEIGEVKAALKDVVE